MKLSECKKGAIVIANCPNPNYSGEWEIFKVVPNSRSQRPPVWCICRNHKGSPITGTIVPDSGLSGTGVVYLRLAQLTLKPRSSLGIDGKFRFEQKTTQPAINRFGVDIAYYKKELMHLIESLPNRTRGELSLYQRWLAELELVHGTRVPCVNCKHDGNQCICPSGCTGCAASGEPANFEPKEPEDLDKECKVAELTKKVLDYYQDIANKKELSVINIPNASPSLSILTEAIIKTIMEIY